MPPAYVEWEEGGGGGEEATCPECHHSLAEPWSASSWRHRWPRQAHQASFCPSCSLLQVQPGGKSCVLFDAQRPGSLGDSEASLGQVAPPLPPADAALTPNEVL